MKKAPPTTPKVSPVRDFAAWTRRVVRDAGAARGVPKAWPDSGEKAKRAGAEQVSAEAVVMLLSTGNLAVLAAIRQHRPSSVRELAALTGRKEESLSRTLKRLAQAGVIGFQDGPHGTRVPMLVARRVRLEIDLTGHNGAVVTARTPRGASRRRQSSPDAG